MIYKFLFFIVFLIVAYIVLFKFNDITFYNRETGKEVFESDEYKKLNAYFQKDEIFWKSNKRISNGCKESLKQQYLDNICDFNFEQKVRLYHFSKKADDILIKLFGRSIHWKFLLLKGDMDWNFPYTIGDVIILPVPHLNDYFTHKESFGISYLVHEAFHVLQKGCLNNHFNNIYGEMGFIHVDIKDKLLQNENIKSKWITNPDGLNGEYIYNIGAGYIAPILLLNENGTHRKMYVELDNKMNIKSEIKNLRECQHFKKYQNVKQNEHPNEIFGSYIEHLIDNKM